MIIPVRCFSCGRVIGSDYRRFESELNQIRIKNRDPTPDEISAIMDKLGLERYCCRRMVLSQIELIDEIMPFS
ncbi:MAG: DNA-directed RNA polymerase subunit N [Candidatus Thermoplasmatota archaeon]|nr:DNA-directed RNA polymerase subunit N [Candidatus Thermoplasmatota archaeon]MCL5888908.1 DNA-directed RNA polymerase subunit N [Candidatus Thermoplasmatota archaeon]